jgi:hypothetical protein
MDLSKLDAVVTSPLRDRRLDCGGDCLGVRPANLGLTGVRRFGPGPGRLVG